jgi:CRISPR/Cas system-associated exonuclease Cas4 (RecB family)
MNKTIDEINKYHEGRPSLPRPHLGASLIGHKCERFLWLSFRWAVREKFEGRLLRLFRRGQNEEATIIKDLRSIGVDIRSSQDKVDFGKHFGGSVDGIIYSGLPEMPNEKFVAEFKTHSKKSFDDLEKNGLQKSKPLHYAQVQTYLAGLKFKHGFYLAVCKDDDRIYTEIVEFDKEFANKLINKAHTITMSDRMPPPLTTDPTYFECRFCPAHTLCHKTKMTTEVNCRTCAHFTVKEDNFRCERWDDNVPLTAQYAGCDSHVLHPDLVPYQFKPYTDEWSAIYVINGKDVVNGESGFKSGEIIANPDECAEPSEFTKELRETMGARIV